MESVLSSDDAIKSLVRSQVVLSGRALSRSGSISVPHDD